MNLIQAFDGWMIGRAEAVLRWLNEWLSISWRQVTTAVIVAHAVCVCTWAALTNEGVLLFMVPLMALFLLAISMMPEAKRVTEWRTAFMSIYRVSNSYMIVLTVIGWLRPNGLAFGWLMAVGWSFLLASLLFLACGDAGIRGRRRKASVAKIRAMFGTEWMVKPLPTPV